MNIMFVYTLEDTQSKSKPLRSWENIQFGISYISSVLKADGHQTQLVVLGSNHSWQDNQNILQSKIESFSPQVVCFTSVASQYRFIKKIAEWIKGKWSSKYLVIGGVHATLNPAEVINDAFDVVCVSEGEYPLLDLCRQLSENSVPHDIANLWIKSADGNIEKNPSRPYLRNLDELPFPDREMWLPWIKEQRGAELVLLLGRGCPYDCSYCCNHALRKISQGKYVRFRSPENIISEIKLLHATYPNKTKIYLEVETIAANKVWLTDFCDKLAAFNATINNSISYGCNFRITMQTSEEKIFLALKKANFYGINIGLEAGSEKIRREVLNRNYTNQNFLDVISMARKVGLEIVTYNMIGLPHETFADYLETVSLNRQCQPDSHSTGIFFPYPGTKLYDLCIKEGYINSTVDDKLERKKAVIDYPNFSKSQIKNAYVWFDYRVYKGNKSLLWIFKRIVMTKIRSNSTLYSLFRKIVQLPGFSYLREKLSN